MKATTAVLSSLVLFYLPLNAFLPAWSQYVIARRCDAMQVQSPSLQCTDAAVSASAAQWDNYVMQACNVPGFFVSLLFGELADRLGRRPLLLFNLTTQCVGAMGLFLNILLHWPLWTIVPTFVINGIGGGSFTFGGLAMAVVADCTPPQGGERARLISFLTGLTFLCSAAGPLLGGYVVQFFGQELAAPGAGGNFFVIFALFFTTNIAALVVVVFGYQETLVVAPGAQPSTLRGVWLEQSAWRLWARPAVQAWRSRPLRQLSASYALYYAALMSFRTIATFFAKKAPYDYGPEAIGWLVALQGIVRALAILALLPLWLHMRSSANLTRHATPGGGNAMLLQAMRFGLVWGVLTILALAASVRTGGGAVLFTLTAAQGIDGICDATARPLFSALAPAGHSVGGSQGSVFGLVVWLQLVTAVLAPLIFNNIYSATVGSSCPTCTFYALAIVVACSLALTWQLDVNAKDGEPSSRVAAPSSASTALLADQEKMGEASRAVGHDAA